MKRLNPVWKKNLRLIERQKYAGLNRYFSEEMDRQFQEADDVFYCQRCNHKGFKYNNCVAVYYPPVNRLYFYHDTCYEKEPNRAPQIVLKHNDYHNERKTPSFSYWDISDKDNM